LTDNGILHAACCNAKTCDMSELKRKDLKVLNKMKMLQTLYKARTHV